MSRYYLAEPRGSALVVGELHHGLLELHARLNVAGAELSRPEMAMEDEGLGRLPSHLPSAGALLLFNSRKTPYTMYPNPNPPPTPTARVARADDAEARRRALRYDTEFDNLLPAELRKRRSSLGEADLLAALASAPESVVRGMALPDVFQIDYQCAPRAPSRALAHRRARADRTSSV